MPIKGVIVAAGYGTRFLPVTRTVPKELLPVVDRPAIDLVIQEFVDAGIEEVLIITSRRKKALDDWFDHDPELEAALTRSGKTDRLAKAQPPKLTAHFIRQKTMRGTGDAILHAKTFAGDDPIVVAFPDDLFGQPNATQQLIDTHKATGAAVLAALDLTGQDVSPYGVIAPLTREDGAIGVSSIVEKPAPGTEPSHLISVGRYLYTPALLEALARHRPETIEGEYYPMAAMTEIAQQGGLVACPVTAQRWDTGTPLGMLQCAIDNALERDDIGPALRAWLQEKLA